MAALAVLSALLTLVTACTVAPAPRPPGPQSTTAAHAPSEVATGSGPGGATESHGSFRLVALGDSVPTATACGCTGYVDLLADRLGRLTGRTPTVHNDATDGWATPDVVADLESPTTRADLRGADLVVVEVGANDFDLDRVDDPSCFPAADSPCWTATIDAMKRGLTQILQTVHTVDANPTLRIAVVGYWNLTVDGAVGRTRGPDFVRGSDELTRAVNGAIVSVATGGGATYVDAYAPFKGANGTLDPTKHLLDDGDHPNQSGHLLIMQAILSALEADGAVAGWERG